MSDKEKDGLGLPPVSSVVILLVVIGAVFFNIQNLKSSRPTVNSTSEYMRHTEDVRARLWQDPFDAAYKHEEDGPSHDGIHSHYVLADKIAGDNETRGKDIHIIGVMVEGGHYFESVEQKRRRRYAVVSALNVSGYKPEDAQKIGYFLTGEHKFKNEYNFELPERIPYELYKYKETGEASRNKPLIVLLWLDEEVFGNDFLSKINVLTEVLHLNSNASPDRLDQVKFTILGPASSTTLKSMVGKLGSEVQKNEKWEFLEDCLRTKILETKQTRDQYVSILDFSRLVFFDNRSNVVNGKNDRWHNLKNMKFAILSPIATAEKELLVENLPSVEKDIEQLFLKNFPKGSFFRTIKSDYKLGKCIYDELVLRGVKPGNDHIVLISEWDTDYGSALPLSFKKAFKDGYKKTTNEADAEPEKAIEETIITYSYIRGLDGQVSDDLPSDPSGILQFIKDNNKAERGYNTSKGYANPSMGNGQFDYLERMGDMIQNKNSKLKKYGDGRIKAIGVLGSDEYDKLLVLQALRKRFPEVIFFTTDLDTRFLDPDEIKWTRNLIVASNFGLRLHPGLQNGIPPFRDNYQTSVYLSTLLALNINKEIPLVYDVTKLNGFGVSEDNFSSSIPKTVLYNYQIFSVLLGLNTYQDQIYSLISPKIFEIGRQTPCELLPVKHPITNSENTNVILITLQTSFPSMENSIYPDSPTFVPGEKQIYLLFYSVIFGVILFVSMIYKKKEKTLSLILVLSYAFIISLFYYSTREHVDNTFFREPFSLIEGISIWPAEVLRSFSILCSALCLYYCYKRLKVNIVDLDEKYFVQGGDNEDDSSLSITMSNISDWHTLLDKIQQNRGTLAKKIFTDKLIKDNQLEQIETIDVNKLTEKMKKGIIEVLNTIKDDLTLYKDNKNDADENGIKLSTIVRNEIKNLKILDESGELKIKESDLSPSKREDIRWFNITILMILFSQVRLRCFPYIKVSLTLLTSLAFYLFVWNGVSVRKEYNLIWILTLIGLLIWFIADYLYKPTYQKVIVRTHTNPWLIFSLIILSIIISIVSLSFWDFFERSLEDFFYLIWVLPIVLSGCLNVKYLDNFVLSKKWNWYREDGEYRNKYYMHHVWYFYRKFGETRYCCLRSAMTGTTFLLFSVFIMKLFGELHTPFRGNWSKYVDMFITCLSFLLFVFLLFSVVDSTRHCIRFVKLIIVKGIAWSDETRKKFGIIPGINGAATDYWLKIRLIADRTEVVNNLIFYPIWVILFIFVSYITYFDNWIVPLSLYLLFGFSLLTPILCSSLLRKEALKAREVALIALKEALLKEAGTTCSGYKIKDMQNSVKEQLNLFISEVNGIRKGAFVPLFQQPFVKSIVYLLGIIGAVLSQYFVNR